MSRSERLLESDIKALILNRLKAKKLINSKTLLMNELTIGNFARRVDLAILHEGKLIAFEIKSEADSLTRLNGQLSTYQKYFDKVIVVADTKFIKKLKVLVPDNIGLWEVKKPIIKVIKRGKLNKKIENSNLLDFMDVVDMKKLASQVKIDSNNSRSSLENALLPIPNSTLRKGVLSTIDRKFSLISSNFLAMVGNDCISNNHIRYLSRYHRDRAIQKEEANKARSFWLDFDSHIQHLKDDIKSMNSLT